MSQPDRVLFITGKLAAPALESILKELQSKVSFEPVVHVAKISVAALMTTDWLARQLTISPGIRRAILPGACRGDLSFLERHHPGVVFEKGPADLLDLPAYFDQAGTAVPYGDFDIEIITEINHANRLALAELQRYADGFRSAGADVIDLGCTPGEPWRDVDKIVRSLIDQGHRVSIDTFDPDEASVAARAGAKLVLSVNSSNVDRACDWGCEVVVVPDDHRGPGWLDEMARTGERLARAGVELRFDPIIEPIGFGFAASLARYIEVRRVYPDAAVMMGVGNITELTAVDSAGVNAILIGFCQELGIKSVLTTEVIPWARGSTAEIDVARRLMRYACHHHRLPKHVDDRLVILRDPKTRVRGDEELRRMQSLIKDPNFRLFAESGRIIAFNNELYEEDCDAFRLFDRLGIEDPSHAFYLGWEMMKAKLALQLGKQYTQDQSLRWGLFTVEEITHRLTRASAAAKPHDP